MTEPIPQRERNSNFVLPTPLAAWELEGFERVDGLALIQDYSEPTPEGLALLREYWDEEEAFMISQRD